MGVGWYFRGLWGANTFQKEFNYSIHHGANLGAYTYQMNIPDIKYRISNEYLECENMSFDNKTEDAIIILSKYYNNNMGPSRGPSRGAFIGSQ